MFTGIIEETGIIRQITNNTITINCKKVLEDTKLGDSIAVDGVCLTVRNIDNIGFSADISPETKKITILSKLKIGSIVNLERAMKLSDRIGGHIVSGHIDTVGEIISIKKTNDFYELEFEFEKHFNKLVVPKGSISINGISLTIAECRDNRIKTAIIPHTFENTVLKLSKEKDNVNIEFDILAKYVEKNLLSKDNNKITMDILQENGFL